MQTLDSSFLSARATRRRGTSHMVWPDDARRRCALTTRKESLFISPRRPRQQRASVSPLRRRRRGRVLQSATVGALPILNRFLGRLRLGSFLRAALPVENRRTKLSPVKALLERELRQAMQKRQIESLPLYPEGRVCRWPSARRVIDVFASVQRHTLMRRARPAEVLVSELTPLQRRLLKLRRLTATDYGR